jgi:hypothetical protein
VVSHSASRRLQATTRTARRVEPRRDGGVLYIMDCHSMFHLSISVVLVSGFGHGCGRSDANLLSLAHALYTGPSCLVRPKSQMVL